MKIGLFFGSFNPVHVGHMIIANYCAQFTDLREVWLVPSPQNPHKQAADLWPDEKRLDLLRAAVDYKKIPIGICEIEFGLSRPSYTIDTLRALQKKHPHLQFVIIMGADNLVRIEQWKEAQTILQNYELYVYPRLGYNTEELCVKYGAKLIPAPIIEISSTFIRKALAEGKNVNAFLPDKVAEIISTSPL